MGNYLRTPHGSTKLQKLEYPLSTLGKTWSWPLAPPFFESGVFRAGRVWHCGAGAELEKWEQRSPKHPLKEAKIA